MEYREEPPSDPEKHFALDALIDYTFSLIMHRACIEEALENRLSLQDRQILMSEWEDVTTDIAEVPISYQQFLFRNF